MTSAGGTLVSINVGKVQTHERDGRRVTTAIWKSPVSGPVTLADHRVGGDEQADLEHHGGYDKAVYAYAVEDLRWWEGELGSPLTPGQFGENFTTRGIDVNGALIGERWEVGSATIEVAEPRVPCSRLAMRMGDSGFVKRFNRALRPGAYLRIIQEGQVESGDRIACVARPAHGLTVHDVFRIRTVDKHEAARLLDIPQLPSAWIDWAREELAKGEPDR